MTGRLSSTGILCLLLGAAIVTAQDRVDGDTIARIRDEGLQRSGHWRCSGRSPTNSARG